MVATKEILRTLIAITNCAINPNNTVFQCMFFLFALNKKAMNNKTNIPITPLKIESKPTPACATTVSNLAF